jgi:hypothetical protein
LQGVARRDIFSFSKMKRGRFLAAMWFIFRD